MKSFRIIDLYFAALRSLPLVAVCVWAGIVSQPAIAGSITYFQFTDAGSQDFSMINNLGGSQTITDSSPVTFYFSNIPGLPVSDTSASNPISGTLTLTANSNANVGTSIQGSNTEAFVTGFTGSMTFSAGGVTYLSVAFGSPNGATLAGNEGGQSASFQDSVPPTSEVYFYSSVLNFSSQTQENFSISLSSLTNQVNDALGFNVQGVNVDNFLASASGTFASSPGPTAGPTPVPEPVAVVCIGFGLFALGAKRCIGERSRRK
jgi:hypothetical protein